MEKGKDTENKAGGDGRCERNPLYFLILPRLPHGTPLCLLIFYPSHPSNPSSISFTPRLALLPSFLSVQTSYYIFLLFFISLHFPISTSFHLFSVLFSILYSFLIKCFIVYCSLYSLLLLIVYSLLLFSVLHSILYRLFSSLFLLSTLCSIL